MEDRPIRRRNGQILVAGQDRPQENGVYLVDDVAFERAYQGIVDFQRRVEMPPMVNTGAPRHYVEAGPGDVVAGEALDGTLVRRLAEGEAVETGRVYLEEDVVVAAPDVIRLEPGHMLRADDGGARIEPWDWGMPTPRTTMFFRDDQIVDPEKVVLWHEGVPYTDKLLPDL